MTVYQQDQKALFASKADWKKAMENALEEVEKKNEPIRQKNKDIRVKNETSSKRGRKTKELDEYTVWTEGKLKKYMILSIKSILDSVFGVDLIPNEFSKQGTENYRIAFTRFAKWDLSIARGDHLKARHTRLLEEKKETNKKGVQATVNNKENE